MVRQRSNIKIVPELNGLFIILVELYYMRFDHDENRKKPLFSKKKKKRIRMICKRSRNRKIRKNRNK